MKIRALLTAMVTVMSALAITAGDHRPAFASHDAEIIHACVEFKDGSVLRIVAFPQLCDPRKEALIEWNKEGPVGPQGPEGPPGPPGPPGSGEGGVFLFRFPVGGIPAGPTGLTVELFIGSGPFVDWQGNFLFRVNKVAGVTPAGSVDCFADERLLFMVPMPVSEVDQTEVFLEGRFAAANPFDTLIFTDATPGPQIRCIDNFGDGVNSVNFEFFTLRLTRVTSIDSAPGVR